MGEEFLMRKTGDLVRAAQSGDRQARERLVRSVQEQVYFHCLRIVGDPDDAMDAAQDILIAMIGGLGSLREPEAFPGWLDRITVRISCRYLKQRQRELKRTIDLQSYQAGAEDCDDVQQEPEKLLDTEENRRMVVELVDALPPPQRLCALLYYYDEMSVKDIAAILHIPVNTVKSRLHYARQAVRKGADRRGGIWALGVSPVPFLRYFLQQEAASGLLGTAAAGLTQSVLAAGGAAAGGLAIGTALKAALDAFLGQKALVLAGLALAGAVTGGVIASQTPKPTVEPHIRAEEPVRPAGPEAPAPPAAEHPVQTEVPVREQAPAQPEAQPLPAEPVSTPAYPTVQRTPIASPEPPTEVPEEPENPEAAQPEDPELPPPVPPEDPLPPEGPDEADGPEEPEDSSQGIQIGPGADARPEESGSRPVWEPSFDLPSRPQPAGPEPEAPEPAEPATDEPEPDKPAPVEPPTDEPPTDEPATDETESAEPTTEEAVRLWTKAFSDYVGNGGYGYTTNFREVWGNFLPPVETAYTSSNPSVAAINEDGTFSTLAPGTAVLSAVMELEGIIFQYDLTVTVEDEFRWLPWLPDCALTEGGTEPWISLDGMPTGQELHFVSAVWHSSDPKVASVHNEDGGLAARIHPGAAGEAVITVDLVAQVDTVAGTKEMGGSSFFTVTVEPDPSRPEPPEPAGRRRELTEFGSASGYGYTRFFREMWDEILPEALTGYTSSDPDVACILETGEFSTLSAGTAELSAVDPDDPEHPYTLILHVQDRLDWIRSIDNGTAWLDLPRSFNVVGYSVHPDKRPLSSVWESGDTSIVTAEPSGYWAAGRLTGKALGETDVTVTFFFEVQTVVGALEMQDTLQFHVTVAP